MILTILIAGIIIALLIVIGVPILLILLVSRLNKISYFDHVNDPIFWNMAPKTMARTAEHFAKMRLYEAKEHRENNSVVQGDLLIEKTKLQIMELERKLGVNPGGGFDAQNYDQPSPVTSSSPQSSPGPGSH